jgi:hypothetical protein
MTNRQERRGFAWLVAAMALIGMVGHPLQDRHLIGLAVVCIPTGAHGLLGAVFNSQTRNRVGRRV